MNSARGFMRMAFWLSGLAALAAMHPTFAQEPVVDPPGRVARLSLMDGEVTMAPADSEDWADAVLNRPLTSGDRLAVGTDGRAELQAGSATIHLDRDTTFGFIELDDDVMQASLTEGAATLRVRRLGERETVQVETPNASVFLRHPGEYHFEIDADRTIVKARSGEAEVVGRTSSHRVRANEEGVFTGLDDLTAQIGPIAPRTAFEAWANDRDRRDDRSNSSRYVSREVIGYEDLDDHGDWIDEPSYGHVWRPRYVVHDWAPYRYGRWAWVAPWGWTWIDDAPWGFAPFHYGRWAHVRNRWCWVPGPHHLRPVYAPALVGWIGGPSVSVSLSFGSGVGWYPLGPRDIYVPGYRHTPRYVRYVNESNTIIVNNNHYTNIYGRRGRDWDHRHREHPGAITVADRDRFSRGRRIGGDRMRVDDRELRNWRDHVRADIEPDRNSVLAGQPRRPPPARNDFADGPKRGSDFQSARQRVLSGDAKRERMMRGRGDSTPDQPVKTPHRPALRADDESSRRNERLEIMRAEESNALRQRAERSRPVEIIRPAPQREQRVAPEREFREREYRHREQSNRQDTGRSFNREDSGRSFRPGVTPGKPPVHEPRQQPRQESRSSIPRQPEQRSTHQHRQNDGGKSSSARPARQQQRSPKWDR